MPIKKTLLIVSISILTVFLTGCSFSLVPGSGGGRAINGKGVLKSEDGGLNWQEKNTIAGSEATLTRHNVHKIATDIFDENILYLSTNSGFYLSENAGDSWRPLIPNSSINDFILNPKTHGLIYVATGNQVLKTTNNGKNWETIYTEARPNISIASLAISHFDTSIIYILTSNGTLMQSTNWGSSWKPFYNFKFNTRQLLVNPHNSQNMYVVADSGLYQSNDEGKTWDEILAEQDKNFPGIKQFKQLSFTSQPNTLIYLSHYGILKSQDNGNSWQPYTLITPPGSVDISSFTFNPDNLGQIYYTVGNILYETLDAGHNWKTKLLPITARAKVNQLLFVAGGSLYIGLTQ